MIRSVNNTKIMSRCPPGAFCGTECPICLRFRVGKRRCCSSRWGQTWVENNKGNHVKKKSHREKKKCKLESGQTWGKKWPFASSTTSGGAGYVFEEQMVAAHWAALSPLLSKAWWNWCSQRQVWGGLHCRRAVLILPGTRSTCPVCYILHKWDFCLWG